MVAAASADLPVAGRDASGHEADGGAVETRVALRIDNIPHIHAAYGAGAAQLCIEALLDEIAGLRLRGCAPDETVQEGFILSFGQMAPQEAADMLEAVLARFSFEPLRHDGAAIHLALSWSLPARTERPPDCPPPIGAPVGRGEAWADSYRADMAEIARAFAVLLQGGLSVAWQAVRDAVQPSRVLYHEALTRIGGGELMTGVSAARLFPALERLGLARAFDRHVMAAMLDELESCPEAVIGVNVSGVSASFDGWWVSLFERLQRRPSVARRLVAEITETAQLAADACRFAAGLRRHGVRVALDDFGMGFASIRNAIKLDPDIVKVDAFFMPRGPLSRDVYEMLRHLTGIAATISPIVIIEGVEAEEQSGLARRIQTELAPRSGGCWQQGYLFDRPSHAQPWRRHPRIIAL